MSGLVVTLLVALFVVVIAKKLFPGLFPALGFLVNAKAWDSDEQFYDPSDTADPINHGLFPGDVGYDDNR